VLFRFRQLTTLVMLLCCVRAEVCAQDVSMGPTPTSTQAIEPSSLSPVEPPPGPIIVNYQNRQLMIEARNSTLSSLLRAACYETRHSSRCTA
jgi:hypothetical protein